MKIYIDILLLINFFCDFLILYSVSVLLKINIKFRRIILSSLFGSLSLIVLFIKVNNTLLFLLKLLLASFMIIIAFGYKNIKYFISSLIYFFLNSLLLGGFIYLINLKLKNNSINSLFNNNLLLIVLSPLIIYIYTKYLLKLKKFYSLKYKVDIYIKGQVINLNAYNDTGINIIDPYKERPIIIINKGLLDERNLKYLLIPCNTVNDSFLLKCFKADNAYIKGVGNIKNVLIGISPIKINIEGVDSLINKNLLEANYENNRSNKKFIKKK
jgi:stage II sporulation protein GA (sporulation sigma-E factor processing peptidase)